MDNKALEKYIGWRFNKMTINTIEHEFDTYRVIFCDFNEFNREYFLEGLIKDIKFN